MREQERLPVTVGDGVVLAVCGIDAVASSDADLWLVAAADADNVCVFNRVVVRQRVAVSLGVIAERGDPDVQHSGIRHDTRDCVERRVDDKGAVPVLAHGDCRLRVRRAVSDDDSRRGSVEFGVGFSVDLVEPLAVAAADVE